MKQRVIKLRQNQRTYILPVVVILVLLSIIGVKNSFVALEYDVNAIEIKVTHTAEADLKNQKYAVGLYTTTEIAATTKLTMAYETPIKENIMNETSSTQKTTMSETSSSQKNSILETAFALKTAVNTLSETVSIQQTTIQNTTIVETEVVEDEQSSVIDTLDIEESVTETSTNTEVIVTEDTDVDMQEWSGEVLTPSAGTVQGPSGKETYYNLDMSGVVEYMRSHGYDYEYWVREDGVKMFGEYVMCAADLSLRPKGTLIETSLGMGIVCDTGGFVHSNPYQLDIAVNW